MAEYSQPCWHHTSGLRSREAAGTQTPPRRRLYHPHLSASYIHTDKTLTLLQITKRVWKRISHSKHTPSVFLSLTHTTSSFINLLYSIQYKLLKCMYVCIGDYIYLYTKQIFWNKTLAIHKVNTHIHYKEAQHTYIVKCITSTTLHTNEKALEACKINSDIVYVWVLIIMHTGTYIHACIRT